MGFGILDDNKLPHIPGTVLLDQEAAQSEGYTQRLKHGTGGNVNIILVPQPSEDPNDPLNWSSFRKNLSFGILCFGAMIWAAVNVPLSNINTDLRELCLSPAQFRKQLSWMSLLLISPNCQDILFSSLVLQGKSPFI